MYKKIHDWYRLTVGNAIKKIDIVSACPLEAIK
jgi:hypothetical protein